MTSKIANKNARKYVQNTKEFNGSHLYARWLSNGIYVVYSYGTHFPMFIKGAAHDAWLENSDGYSRSTARHRSQVHPHVPTIQLGTEQMQAVIHMGSIAAIVQTSCEAIASRERVQLAVHMGCQSQREQLS